MLVQAGMVKKIIAKTGERKGLVLGLVISTVAMCGYGLATRGWMIYAVVLIGTWGGIAGPAAQSLITRHVPPNEQGAIQGSLMGLQSLATIIAPLVATWSFGVCINPPHNLPGIAFFLASGLFIVALALAFRSFQLDDRLPAWGLPSPAVRLDESEADSSRTANAGSSCPASPADDEAVFRRRPGQPPEEHLLGQALSLRGTGEGRADSGPDEPDPVRAGPDLLLDFGATPAAEKAARMRS